MKKTLIIAVVFVALITSCRRGGEPSSDLEFFFLNNAEREIKMVFYDYNKENDTIDLEMNEKYLLHSLSVRGDMSGSKWQTPPYGWDSVIVYYNDTLFVPHLNNIGNYQLNNNIFDRTNWEFIELGNSSFESIYEFTEADYQEALEL